MSIRGIVERYMPQGVAGRRHDDEGGGAQRHGVVVADGYVDAGDLVRFGAGAGDGDVEVRFEDGNTLDVVAVMMGDENVRQRPAAMVQRRLDGPGIGRVDRGGLARFEIVHEITVIIGAAREDVDKDRHDGLAPAVRRPESF